MAGLSTGSATATWQPMDFVAIDAAPPAQRQQAGTVVHDGSQADVLEWSLVRDLAGLEALEADWSALHRRSARPEQLFQSFAWNRHWASVYLDAGAAQASISPIAILAGRRAGQLVTLWPLVVNRRGGLREISWMGEPVSQYGDILLDPAAPDGPAIVDAGWAYLCRHLKPDVARFRKVRSDATIHSLLETIGTLHTAELEAPYIDLTRVADFAAYMERFSSRCRRNRQRQMRRLQEAGKVSFQHLDPGPAAAEFAGVGIAIKRQWLLDCGHVSPALADVRMAQFMAAIAADDRSPTGTRVAVMLSGGTPAAIQIAFTAGHTRLLHVIAYDRAYDRMAAGALHLEEFVRQGFAEGLTRIDLLAPKAEYKREWADGAVAVIDHAIGLTLPGRVYAKLYLRYVRTRLKSAIERLPRGVRRILALSHLRGRSNSRTTGAGVA